MAERENRRGNRRDRDETPEFADRLNTGPRGGVMVRPDAPEGIRP